MRLRVHMSKLGDTKQYFFKFEEALRLAIIQAVLRITTKICQKPHTSINYIISAIARSAAGFRVVCM